jgi:hypothetical protein
MIGRNHELVEIALRIDGDEAGQCARLLRDNDRGIRHEFAPPALAPPRDARGEVDCRIGHLPGVPPQFDRGVFVLGAIAAEVEGRTQVETQAVMPGLVPTFAKASADWHLSPAKPWRRRVPGIHVLSCGMTERGWPGRARP